MLFKRIKLSRKLLHNFHNVSPIQNSSKLRCNFNKPSPIQITSKLAFAFTQTCYALLYAWFCLVYTLCSLRSAPSFSLFIPLKKPQLSLRLFFGCLTWIRTKTNCTKNSCATVTPSGNPYAILRMECKNRGQHKIFQIFMPFKVIIINLC